MLRANHFVNGHEQGVRTRREAPRASWRQDRPDPGGGQKLVALVVRKAAEQSGEAIGQTHYPIYLQHQ